MATSVQDQCVKQMGDPSHLSHLSSGLNQLRHQAAFCDVTIIVGDQGFPAHKAVLSCASDYFQGMFSSGFQESTMSEIIVPGTEESFVQILDFYYTGHFTLSLTTVTGIIKMACYMVLTTAVQLCAEYLKNVKDKLPVEDCFEIWSIASNHNSLSEVAQIYRSHVVQNFLKCVKSEVFLENSSASVMMEILSDEEIETDTVTEEHILQGTVMWLKYDWEQRKAHAVDLLKKIRLGLVPVDRLLQIHDDELLAIPACKDMVKMVVKLSDIMDIASPQVIKSHPDLFATRNTITSVLHVNHGINHDGYKLGSGISIECRTETACYKLTKFADFPSKFTYQESDDLTNGVGLLVSDAGHLYGGGGKEFASFSTTPERLESHYKCLSENNFFRYNSEKNEWNVLPPMLKIRHLHQLIQLDEFIYSIGSTENAQLMNSVMEKYSFSSNKWEIVRDELGFMAVHVVIVNGYLLIKGIMCHGEQTSRIEVVKVALYKPAKDEWWDVHISPVRQLEQWSFFAEVDNICYLVITDSPKIKKVLCDFESDRPSIRIAETVKKSTDKCTYMKIKEALQSIGEFTFDKHKVGMIPMECSCKPHTENGVNKHR
ncbi:kelch repeat and BTB domain-containing protein 2-like isoform X1 [Amphiura filiformis]|uniref:kelch repeat and BTB domain-containing protein 2-like isoform X1 n=1 Tax=Amphiura filiformis TaxID=82378 RepID=UPI003B20D073